MIFLINLAVLSVLSASIVFVSNTVFSLQFTLVDGVFYVVCLDFCFCVVGAADNFRTLGVKDTLSLATAAILLAIGVWDQNLLPGGRFGALCYGFVLAVLHLAAAVYRSRRERDQFGFFPFAL